MGAPGGTCSARRQPWRGLGKPEDRRTTRSQGAWAELTRSTAARDRGPLRSSAPPAARPLAGRLLAGAWARAVTGAGALRGRETPLRCRPRRPTPSSRRHRGEFQLLASSRPPGLWPGARRLDLSLPLAGGDGGSHGAPRPPALSAGRGERRRPRRCGGCGQRGHRGSAASPALIGPPSAPSRVIAAWPGGGGRRGVGEEEGAPHPEPGVRLSPSWAGGSRVCALFRRGVCAAVPSSSRSP